MTMSADRMRARMRPAGRVSFWIQATVGVVSAIFWLVVLVGQISTGGASPGAQIALWATLFTLVSLAGNCFLTFRYWQSRETRNLKTVLYVSLFSAFLAVISSAAQIGDLLASLIFRQVLVARQEEWGLLLATLNANITIAHLVSLTAVLWIYGIIFDGKSGR